MQDTSSSLVTGSSPKLSYSVDPEHGALRFAVVFVFVVVAVLIYAVIAVVLPSDAGINFIGVGGGLIGAAVFTQIVDRFLKQKWPSGRTVEVYDDRIILNLRGTPQRTIDPSAHVNVMMWRFEITKRTRIPKGWYMVAIALMQEDLYLPIYTFMSPKAYEDTPLSKEYVKLASKKQQTDQDMRLAGQQRRLHNAEEARWIDGAEMAKDDFEALIVYLSQNYQHWMPTE